MKKFDDIVIAVHGIGSQSRFSTVRSVATRLAASSTLLGDGKDRPIGLQPLGYYHSDVQNITSVRLLDDVESLKGTDLASIGFAEVFWADIPQEVVKEGRTLEETKAWARTVVARANALCKKAAKPGGGRDWIVPPDFSLAGEVLDEIIETVYVLQNLSRLGEKAGLFTFDLKKVLDEYLGDVQLVAEFSYYRNDIVGRFHRAMESIHHQHPGARIHIVAHSEGTVVSFLGLLQAMSRKRVVPASASGNARIDPIPWVPEKEDDKKVQKKEEPPFASEDNFPAWLKQVRGYMTIGSPIDKHLLLWPRIWDELRPHQANALFKDNPIRWRNYYDYGDPVGFKLDTTRRWLMEEWREKKNENESDKRRNWGEKCTAFQFCGCPNCEHDIGFARYLLPGAAHNEYWNDCDVFEHFIKEVVAKSRHKGKAKEGTDKPPRKRWDKWWVAWLSPAIPYAASFLILLIGVFILYKAVHAYTHPNADALERLTRFRELGIEPPAGQTPTGMARAVLGITGLIAGATLLARIPRLAIGSCVPANWRQWTKQRMSRFKGRPPGPNWFIAGIVAFLIGALLYLIVPLAVRDELGGRLYDWGLRGTWVATVGIIVLAAAAGWWGYWVTRPGDESLDRRERWVGQGLRPLIACGIFAIGLIVLSQIIPRSPGPPNFNKEQVNSLPDDVRDAIRDARLTPDELNQLIMTQGTNWQTNLKTVAPILQSHPPIWPLLLGSLAFLYLWWLATLLFDLAFVWQRYTRRSVTNVRLHQWNPYGLSVRQDDESPDSRCFCKLEA